MMKHLIVALGLAAVLPVAGAGQDTTLKRVLTDMSRTMLKLRGTASCYRFSAGYSARTGPAGQQVVPPAAESFEEALFTPDLVMRHQDALALTPAQRATITRELKTMEAESIDLRWQVQAEQERLIQALSQHPVREQDAVQRIESLLALEAAVKLKHFTGLLRVKNALNDDQVAQLDQIQRCGPGAPAAGGRGRGVPVRARDAVPPPAAARGRGGRGGRASPPPAPPPAEQAPRR